MKPLFIPIMSDYIRNHLDLGWICDETADMDFLFEYEDKISWEGLSSNQYLSLIHI